MRGNEIAYDMTSLLDKETIDTWKMNYTNEEKYPTVLPSKFPYGLVNGNYGIGVACASYIPPHNLYDVCNAAITLLKNPNATFEEIYCPIDFPTGGTIINEDSVKESLKNGEGKAALVRASIDYNEKDNELVIYEMPYMVFTTNAIKSITTALEEGKIAGIDSITDGTDFDGPKIYIKLVNGVNVKRIIQLLYKHTELQSSFAIKVNMLEDGIRPKLYSWKEQVQTYLNHLRTIVVKSCTYDLNKLENRLHIIEGLLIASDRTEKIIKDIRESADNLEARNLLMKNYSLSEIQAEAILKIKLSQLTKMDIKALSEEKEMKLKERNQIAEILSTEENIKKQMIKDIKTIAKKYGDERRTNNINLDFEDEDEFEPIEKKEIVVYFTNFNNLYIQENNTLVTRRRGSIGNKLKLSDNEVIIKSITDDNFGYILGFSNKGRMFKIPTNEIAMGTKLNISSIFNLEDGEYITTITTLSKDNNKKYYIFTTKKGLIKKTRAEEYNTRHKVIRAILLKPDDEVVSVHFMDEEEIGILSKRGQFVRFDTTEINSIGRASSGVIAINLAENDEVIDSKILMENYITTITKNGLVKKTSISEFPLHHRGGSGVRASKLREKDYVVKFLNTSENDKVIAISNKGALKFNLSDVNVTSRSTLGVKAMNLNDDAQIIDFISSIENSKEN